MNAPDATSFSRSLERRPPPDRARATSALVRFFADRPEVRLAYLFGSVARDLAGAISDVDVAVLLDGESDSSFEYEDGLLTCLTAELACPKVDLSILNRAPARLRMSVVRDGILLKERDPGIAHQFWKAVERGVLESHEDDERVRLERLQSLVLFLRRYTGVSRAELEANTELRLGTAHALQLASQTALSVASHLLAARSAPPDSYESIAIELESVGLVPRDVSVRVARMARLRDSLVHGYLEVDASLLRRALSSLDDFDEFARYALLALDCPA